MLADATKLISEKPTAIIITVKQLGEADLLVFFLDQLGVLRRAVAKNARRSMKRFLNCLEPLSVVSLSYEQGRSGVFLKEAQLQEGFYVFREDPIIMGLGKLIEELLMAFLPENDPHEESFNLTMRALNNISVRKMDPLLVIVLWILRLMTLTGYAPLFDRCDLCGVSLDKKKRWVWQLEPLRCVCADHYLTGSFKWEWDVEVLMFLRSVRTLPLDRIWRLRLSSTKLMALFRNICCWCETILQAEIKSYRWLERLMTK
ncbi:MAG: DNA repair protein RecO [Thermodesulforhabdaceae bacterium]